MIIKGCEIESGTFKAYTPYSFGNALHFDDTVGTYAKGSVSGFTNGFTTMTISFWLYMDDTSDTTQTILGVFPSGSWGWSFRWNGSLIFSMSTASYEVSFPSISNTVLGSRWNHIGLSMDLNQSANVDKFKISFNGTIINPKNYSFSGSAPSSVAATSCFIALSGYNGHGSLYGFDGLLDDVAIWSDADIQKAVNCYNPIGSTQRGAAPISTNLLRWWKLNESGTTTTAVDETATENLTLNSFTWAAGNGWEAHT